MTNHDEFVEHFWEGVTDKTRVIFLSQITSSTGLIFPVSGICKKAREAGILTIIDGAHVPGHIPLNIREMDPDIYTGACHKWLSAPKGTTFLYVRKDFQESIKPLIISWGAIIDPSPSPFIHENQYQGTRDPSPFLAVPAAIRFQGENDWELVKLRCCRLTRETRDRVYDIIHTVPICPNSEEWLGQMASVEIEVDDPEKLKNSLLEDYAIEIPVIAWKEKSLLRFSFNVYNEQRDADKLINALRELF
jgi:isopenicillin-N epimerase